MKTKIKFPQISFSKREHFVFSRCEYLCDRDVHEAVIQGRFVLAWDGELENQSPTLGVLSAVTMNQDGSRTYCITSEFGLDRLDYQNAAVLREEWCPDVITTDTTGAEVHKWIGLQERDGKVCAFVTDGDGPSRAVDPSTLILLDDCKLGLPEREEA